MSNSHFQRSAGSESGPVQNTDRHLWPQVSEDAYAPRLFVTGNGEGIGIDVGGSVYVKTLREWHRLAGGPIGISSCGAESNRHSGAVGAEKRAEQSNPGGGHEVTESNSQHENRDKPLPDEPTPAAGRLMRAVAQPTLPWPSREVVAREIRRAMLDNPTDDSFNQRAEKREEIANVYADIILARFAAAQPPAAPVHQEDAYAAWAKDYERSSAGNGAVNGLGWMETSVDRGDGASEFSGFEAETPFGTFYVIEMHADAFRVEYDMTQIGESDTPDEAKRIGQRDFERRIRMALRPDEPQEAPTCPGKGWLAPALESAERRAAEMPDWMRRDKAPEDEGELVVTQYQLMAAQSALREIAGMSHNCRSVDIAKAALAMTRPQSQTGEA